MIEVVTTIFKAEFNQVLICQFWNC